MTAAFGAACLESTLLRLVIIAAWGRGFAGIGLACPVLVVEPIWIAEAITRTGDVAVHMVLGQSDADAVRRSFARDSAVGDVARADPAARIVSVIKVSALGYALAAIVGQQFGGWIFRRARSCKRRNADRSQESTQCGDLHHSCQFA